MMILLLLRPTLTTAGVDDDHGFSRGSSLAARCFRHFGHNINMHHTHWRKINDHHQPRNSHSSWHFRSHDARQTSLCTYVCLFNHNSQLQEKYGAAATIFYVASLSNTIYIDIYILITRTTRLSAVLLIGFQAHIHFGVFFFWFVSWFVWPALSTSISSNFICRSPKYRCVCHCIHVVCIFWGN